MEALQAQVKWKVLGARFFPVTLLLYLTVLNKIYVNNMTRDLGSMAQAKLEEWAAEVLITANRATNDKEGWDYILQFPQSSPDYDLPLDLRPSRIECWVQVKGVETKRNRKSISLSNWDKLITSPLPAFFLVIDYGKENVPRNAFLIHVDQKWMTKVLKRLRQVPEDRKNKIHKLTLDLTWSKVDRLETLDGKGLEASIRKHIEDDFDSYIEHKQKTRKEIGQDAPFLLHFTSNQYKSTRDLITEWVDFAIGVRDSLSISKLTVEKYVRFGIPAERIEKEGGIVSIIDRTKSGKPVKLVVRNKANTQKSTFPAILFTPHDFFPNEPIPQEFLKVRVTSELGELIFRPYANVKEATIKLTIKVDDEPRKLSELANLWRVVRIIQSAPSGGCVIEINDDENPPFKMESIDHKNFSREHLFIAQTIDNAWYLSKVFDLSPDIKLTIDQILQQFHTFAELRQIHDFNYSIDSIAGQLIADDLPLDKEYAAIFSRKLEFNTVLAVVIVGLAGSLSITKNTGVKEKTFKIVKPRRIHFEHQLLPNHGDLNLREILKLASEKIENAGYEVIEMND